MSREWSERSGKKSRMDRRVFCSKRCVCTREERWVIHKRLGGLLPWQAIHSSSKEQQKRRGEIGKWKREDRKISDEEGANDLQACIVVLWIRYCNITSCLSGDEIRSNCYSAVTEALPADFP